MNIFQRRLSRPYGRWDSPRRGDAKLLALQGFAPGGLVKKKDEPAPLRRRRSTGVRASSSTARVSSRR